MSAIWKAASDVFAKLRGAKMRTPEVHIQPTFRLSPTLNVNIGSEKTVNIPTMIEGSDKSSESVASVLEAAVGETSPVVSDTSDTLISESNTSVGSKVILWVAVGIGASFALYGVYCLCRQMRVYFANHDNAEVVPSRAPAAAPGISGPSTIISIKGSLYVLPESDTEFSKTIKSAILKAVQEDSSTDVLRDHQNHQE